MKTPDSFPNYLAHDMHDAHRGVGVIVGVLAATATVLGAGKLTTDYIQAQTSPHTATCEFVVHSGDKNTTQVANQLVHGDDIRPIIDEIERDNPNIRNHSLRGVSVVAISNADICGDPQNQNLVRQVNR